MNKTGRRKRRPFSSLSWQVSAATAGDWRRTLAGVQPPYRFFVVRRVVLRAAFLVERLAVFFLAAFLVVAIVFGS
jgi:hypothetical protein